VSGALDRLNTNLVNAANAVPAEELVAAKARIDDLIVEFDSATRPSQQFDVVAALAHLRQASTILGRALARAHTIVNGLAAYADKLYLNHPVRRVLPPVPTTPAISGADGSEPDTSGGNVVGGGSIAGPSPENAPATSGVRQPDAPVFDPQPYFDQMPIFDRRGRSRPKTHGRWTDAEGTTHSLVSGRHDRYHLLVDMRAVQLGLTPPGAGLQTSGDVELKFAMQMREIWNSTKMPQKETIVINHPDGPCPGALGCDGLLSQFLPPSSELTVYWPGGNVRTYRGESES
jgi:Double-stranded DNA deaminase toxin A